MQQFDSLAFSRGFATRKTHADTEAAHAAYVGMTPTEQTEMKRAWLIGHVAGQLGFIGALKAAPKGQDVQEKHITAAARTAAVAKAEKIVDAGKGADAKAEHVGMIDKAYSDFRYHVVRPTATAAKGQQKKARTSAAEKAAWAVFVQAVGAERAAIVAKALMA